MSRGGVRSIDFLPFKDLIKRRCGLAFDEARTSTLEGAIHERMAERALTSPMAYLDCLTLDNAEFDSLVDLLTVNETYFYREPAQLRLLAGTLVPELLASRKAGQKIRIMSAGCSTGEEPYSIVMALMEAYGENAKALFTVIGADIDSKAIKKAGLACYTRHSLRQFPEELKNRYFDCTSPNVFRLKDTVRSQVSFTLLNLLSPDYPESLKNLDVIFYRNVSIYFEPDVQKAMFSKLSDILNENGYIIVSSTETLSHNIGVMSLVEIDNQFIYQKKLNIGIGNRRRRPADQKDAACPLSAAKPGPEAAPLHPDGRPERREPRVLFDEALELAKKKDFKASVERLDSLIARDPSFAKAYTLKAGVLVNQKDIDAAERMCLSAIEVDRWCLEAFLLLGLIEKIRNDDEAALKRFREALYAQSSCWLAHFYIADIHRSRGETELACREYEIVVRLLGRGSIEEHGLTFFPLSFSVEQIVHLCNHNLMELRKKR